MNKQEFEFDKTILKLKKDNQDKKHKQHLKEIEIQVKLENLRFDHAMQLSRIKSAEMRRNYERKANLSYVGGRQ